MNCNLLLAQLCTLWIALIEKLTEGLIYKWPCKFTWWHTYVCHIKREQKQFDSITVYKQQRRLLFLLCLYANLLMPATHIGIQYRYTAVQNSCPRAHISIWKQGFGNLKRLYTVNLKNWALSCPTYFFCIHFVDPFLKFFVKTTILNRKRKIGKKEIIYEQ